MVAHWNHPVGEVSVLRDLHGTQHGHVEVTPGREGGREGGSKGGRKGGRDGGRGGGREEGRESKVGSRSSCETTEKGRIMVVMCNYNHMICIRTL